MSGSRQQRSVQRVVPGFSGRVDPSWWSPADAAVDELGGPALSDTFAVVVSADEGSVVDQGLLRRLSMLVTHHIGQRLDRLHDHPGMPSGDRPPTLRLSHERRDRLDGLTGQRSPRPAAAQPTSGNPWRQSRGRGPAQRAASSPRSPSGCTATGNPGSTRADRHRLGRTDPRPDVGHTDLRHRHTQVCR